MANVDFVAHGLQYNSGEGVTLKAAGLIAADDADDAGVHLGRGAYAGKLAWTACEIDSNDELYNVQLEAYNGSGWEVLMPLGAFGATEVTGGNGDTPAAGSFVFGFFNPLSSLVRVATYVNGSIATGMNFSVVALPLDRFPK